MEKYGDMLFANKKYGYSEYPSVKNFVIAYLFNKIDLENSTCHCKDCYPCNDETSLRINTLKNL